MFLFLNVTGIAESHWQEEQELNCSVNRLKLRMIEQNGCRVLHKKTYFIVFQSLARAVLTRKQGLCKGEDK